MSLLGILLCNASIKSLESRKLVIR
jgi:hypothetical protein